MKHPNDIFQDGTDYVGLEGLRTYQSDVDIDHQALKPNPLGY